MKGPAPIDVIDRIMRRVVKQDDGCWIFTGYLLRGYGQINLGAKQSRALVHRVTYERLVGPVPDGTELDHTCRTPACCNPDHLDPVTHAENVRRGQSGETQARRFASMTHCRRGHERSATNLYINPHNGKSACRPCKAEWARDKRTAVAV